MPYGLTSPLCGTVEAMVRICVETSDKGRVRGCPGLRRGYEGQGDRASCRCRHGNTLQSLHALLHFESRSAAALGHEGIPRHEGTPCPRPQPTPGETPGRTCWNGRAWWAGSGHGQPKFRFYQSAARRPGAFGSAPGICPAPVRCYRTYCSAALRYSWISSLANQTSISRTASSALPEACTRLATAMPCAVRVGLAHVREVAADRAGRGLVGVGRADDLPCRRRWRRRPRGRSR